MPRFTKHRQGRLGTLLAQIDRRFAKSPLMAIGALLSSVVTAMETALTSRTAAREDADKLANYVDHVLQLLPASFGDRFTFDAQFIHELAQACSRGPAKLSRMLVPKPSQTWGHQTVSMPSLDLTNAHAVDVIHLPGDDEIADIDLLAYPFVCHELGHNILFRQGDAFAETFGNELDAVLVSIQRQTVGIRGSAKQVADATVERVKEYWTPTANHYNWAHEIAADAISLWLAGPAYLAAFQDVLEVEGLDPFQLGQSHPPYEIRAQALVDAAQRLGWAYYSGGIQSALDGWRDAHTAHGKTNFYVACGDIRLLNAAVTAAIRGCEDFLLPRCTPHSITVTSEKLHRDSQLDLGIEMILAAWIVYESSGEIKYQEWEKETIRRTLADLTE